MTATTVFAASYEDSVIAQLRAQGYKRISVERTLLGRVKITASLNGGRREIILNPRTGEVLRDLWIGADGGVSLPTIASNTGGGGNAGGGDDSGGDGGGNAGGGDDNGGDDNSGDSGGDDNDEEDDDNSGSGSDDGDDGDDSNDD